MIQVITIILLWMTLSFAQKDIQDEYKFKIYQAYIYTDIALWKKVIDEMSQTSNKSSASTMQLINYYYGYIAWCWVHDEDDEATAYLDKAEQLLAGLEKSSYDLSMINAYKSAFYGLRIGLNFLKAPFLGPQSVSFAEKAIDLNGKNPWGYIQLANSYAYRPLIFGGSKKRAIGYYQHAVQLMEQDSIAIIHDWNYLNVLLAIAQSFEELKDFEQAKTTYQKILKIEPDFKRVKNIFYPQLLKKIQAR
jgi:tetratricopeptide (TPR) repeat protein